MSYAEDNNPRAGHIAQPSPLQQTAERIPLSDGQALYVIEEVTGSGKTEAALMLAHRLIAAGRTEQELCRILGLDSLHYLSIEGLLEATGVSDAGNLFCKACFDGRYPVRFDDAVSKSCLETT